jgi:hypothetical protein
VDERSSGTIALVNEGNICEGLDVLEGVEPKVKVMVCTGKLLKK